MGRNRTPDSGVRIIDAPPPFVNHQKDALIVRKIDAVTEKPLAGAEFKILTIGGAPVDASEGRISTRAFHERTMTTSNQIS